MVYCTVRDNTATVCISFGLRRWINLSQSSLGVIDGLRQQAWPLLVDSHQEEPLPRILSTKDEQCVQWDVKRWIGQKSELLVQVIERSCRFYYQGYHQVASVMLKTMQDTDLSAQVLQRLYDTHLGKFVSANDLPLSRFLQWMVLPTIWFLDSELHGILAEQEPTFCAPWILTWFSSLEEPRMFDAFIAAHPLFPFYCSMVLVLEHKEQILQDAMTVHKPLQVDDSEKLLTESLQLMGRLPPHKLWVIASHYHGDGEVKELLREGPLANALLTLAAPERPSLVPASPLSQIAFGFGQPPKKRYRRRILLGCVACIIFCFAVFCRGRNKPLDMVSPETAIIEPPQLPQQQRAPTCLRKDLFPTTTRRNRGVCKNIRT